MGHNLVMNNISCVMSQIACVLAVSIYKDASGSDHSFLWITYTSVDCKLHFYIGLINCISTLDLLIQTQVVYFILRKPLHFSSFLPAHLLSHCRNIICKLSDLGTCVSVCYIVKSCWAFEGGKLLQDNQHTPSIHPEDIH